MHRARPPCRIRRHGASAFSLLSGRHAAASSLESSDDTPWSQAEVHRGRLGGRSARGRRLRSRRHRSHHEEVAIDAFRLFFGPKRETVPALSNAEGLRREDAVWASVFGDVGLCDGSWVVLDRLADWDRHAWRMPAFVHRDSLVGLFSLVEYPSDDPGERPVRRRISEDEARGLPDSGSAGSGFVEQRLTKLLS
jgi:hypothetical protein